MKSEKPTRSAAGPHDDYRENHPAYATIGASHSQWGPPGVALFASDFRHQNVVNITIRKADLTRGLHHDYIHGSDQLIEVTLSEAQWATFVSRPNTGTGVPCTLSWTPGGPVPGIIPDTDRRQQLRDEVGDQTMDTVVALRVLAKDARIPKGLREQLEVIANNLGPNLAFIAKSFDEHAEVTIERMKIEVEAYMAEAIRRAGLAALGAPEQPILRLVEGNDGE